MIMSPIRIFIGYEPREAVTCHVLAHSITRHASRPVMITPLVLGQLPMSRPRDSQQSTEFAFSRFLVPWLCDYKGWAIFMDCDMLVRADIQRLWDLREPNMAVQVVKHDYTPKTKEKFLDQPQSVYPRKNWSSMMLFNNENCVVLTPTTVNAWSGLMLHRFEWIRDFMIGGLPAEWNHLVGEYAPNPDAKIAHFTIGSPCFAKYRHCEFSNEWFREWNLMNYHDRTNEFSLPSKEGA